ncbi:MAG: hypothetical protein Pg6C_20140 [Treponemataceae bacterium]|nr:MAG: hypothetical protein Pg6C_20140 [Treponemataceae bacterium]
MFVDSGMLIEELESLIHGAKSGSAETKYEEGLRDGTIYGLMQAQDMLLRKTTGWQNNAADKKLADNSEGGVLCRGA